MDTAELKRLAEAAKESEQRDWQTRAAYTDAANPAAVLELIAEIERLRAALAQRERETIERVAALSDEDIDRLLQTPVPGGSMAGWWFIPHESEKALANIRTVVRLLIGAAHEKTPAVEVPPVLRSALAERRRQIEVEGFAAESDDKKTDCSLAAAAACYALLGDENDISKLQYAGVQVWPWPLQWWKPTTYQRNLEKAIALLIAEAERVARKEIERLRDQEPVARRRWVENGCALEIVGLTNSGEFFGKLKALAAGLPSLDLFAPPAPSVPNGWQLVPKDETREMQLIGRKMALRLGVQGISAADAGDIFRAMLAAAPKPPELTAAARDVLAERRRQIEAEGWTPEHDDDHGRGELSDAAACYALRAHGNKRINLYTAPSFWPWDGGWKPGEPRCMLIKAGALILAEIERIDRAASKLEGEHG